MLDLRGLRRRGEGARGAILGPRPADAVRYRRLMEQWRGRATATPRRLLPSLPPFRGDTGLTPPASRSKPESRTARLASVGPSQWADLLASPAAWGQIPLQASHPVTIEAL